MLAPNELFVMRPMTGREPYSYAAAGHYSMKEIAADLGLELRLDRFAWLDRGEQVVHTREGDAVSYDALLIAVGARSSKRFPRATTLEEPRIEQQMQGVIQDLEVGYIRRVAFVVPSQTCWPLPLYELALLTAKRALEMNSHVSVTLITPESAPLAVFGDVVSREIKHVLDGSDILAITSARCGMHSSGPLTIYPDGRELVVDRVVTVPQLFGPSVPGVPRDTEGGFIAVDEHCRVEGLENVFAAGDGTNFPVKYGGIAAQQADTAARSIAAMAGASVEPEPLRPVLESILLGPRNPLYLRARLIGGRGYDSEVSETPLWSPSTQVASRYLGNYIEARQRSVVSR